MPAGGGALSSLLYSSTLYDECSALLYSTLLCSTLLYSTLLCSTILNIDDILYSTLLYYTITTIV